MECLYLVTGNENKYKEASEILSEYGIKLCMANIDKLEIQSPRLEDIALFAARIAFSQLKKSLIVDDSGLFIDSLKGFPGPYSSYVYKTIGYEGILKLMSDKDNRRACFKTVAVLVYPPIEKIFIGETCGSITTSPRGSRGFGFDPIFVPEGSDQTYAEMDIEEKNNVSHRGKAFRKLGHWLAKNLSVFKGNNPENNITI